jgi:hypothetical protein
MSMSSKSLVLLLVVITAAMRFLPHLDNFSPIGALAIFSGAYITDKRYFILPLVVLFIGDAVTGFYSAYVMIAVYVGFACSAVLAKLMLKRSISAHRFLVATILGALAFYMISNVGMWWVAYPQTPVGLLQCWAEGLPFLARSLAGDLIYGAALFGAIEWHKRSLRYQDGYAT